MTTRQKVIVFLLCFAAVLFFGYELSKPQAPPPTPTPPVSAAPSAAPAK